jgi:hypothetical protein
VPVPLPVPAPDPVPLPVPPAPVPLPVPEPVPEPLPVPVPEPVPVLPEPVAPEPVVPEPVPEAPLPEVPEPELRMLPVPDALLPLIDPLPLVLSLLLPLADPLSALAHPNAPSPNAAATARADSCFTRDPRMRRSFREHVRLLTGVEHSGRVRRLGTGKPARAGGVAHDHPTIRE